MSPAGASAPAAARGEVCVVVTVTFHGADDATVFRADVADRLPDPGQLEPQRATRLVWHGRDRVPGVMPGAWLRVAGRRVEVDGVPTVHNPEYHLLDTHTDAGPDRR